MNQTTDIQSGFGEKIPLVGREEELADLSEKLQSRGDSHVIYYRAGGGMGKTRLLLELVEMVRQEGPGFQTTGIIDLYHTDNHSTSDVERIIVDTLDPDNKYFQAYRRERVLYLEMRERGAGARTLEQGRQRLSQILVDEWLRLAGDMRKLVLIFDTVELLQYESSVVEEMAGLHTVDTLVKTWLLTVLPQLKNVLVVFAGRPKKREHQEHLEAEIKAAFGEEIVSIRELRGLNLPEIRQFVRALCRGEQVLPEEILPVVERLTLGAPIFLHLIVDLMRTLAPVYKSLLDWFREHQGIVTLEDGDPRLDEARTEIKKHILRGIFNEADELGLYLTRIAMMPKGIDESILDVALGLPAAEARDLLARLENLSFVKRFQPLSGEEALFEKRLFLHDELYQLFRLAGVVPNLLVNERQIASTLVRGYYEPRIQELEAKIRTLEPDQRDPDRRMLQKMQVERLYYLMVQNPAAGFAEYQRLSDEANRYRFVGFSMRLHDEFLRFYNLDERRAQFARAGITHEQVIRESAEMWIERFHWWGQYVRELNFAEKIFASLAELHIDPQRDAAVLGNITALYVRSKTMTQGFDPQLADKIMECLKALPELEQSDRRQILARARLFISLGYLYHRGGRYIEAAQHYGAAQTALNLLPEQRDELAMLLNNMAYVQARQGQFELALPLINRATKINETLGLLPSKGLTLSTLASINLLRGYYITAIKWAGQAKDIFNQVRDPWGQILSLQTMANAQRKQAKQALYHELELEEAQQKVLDARAELDEAIELASNRGFETQLWPLYADLGKVYRESARLAEKGLGREEANELYRLSEQYLSEALRRIRAEPEEIRRQTAADEAEIEVNLAELLYYFERSTEEAVKKLNTTRQMLEAEFSFTPENLLRHRAEAANYLIPMGKVERLLGEIWFASDKAAGLQHLYRAYVYFNLFSVNAAEKQSIYDFLYRAMLETRLEERRQLIAGLKTFVDQNYAEFEPTGFVEALQTLLG